MMSMVADHYVIQLARQHGFFLPTEPGAQAEVAREALDDLGIVTAEKLSDEDIMDVAVCGGVELSGLGESWGWCDHGSGQSRSGFGSMAAAARDAVMELRLDIE